MYFPYRYISKSNGYFGLLAVFSYSWENRSSFHCSLPDECKTIDPYKLNSALDTDYNQWYFKEKCICKMLGLASCPSEKNLEILLTQHRHNSQAVRSTLFSFSLTFATTRLQTVYIIALLRLCATH